MVKIMYDYREQMKADVKDYIEENIGFIDYEDLDELKEKLQDDLWTEDNVTGNASGSYTFNRAEAKENVIDNLDLLKEACEEFDCKNEFADKFFDEEWEWMDVTIRCYLLSEIIETVVEEMEL
jgi:hypothetical protein